MQPRDEMVFVIVMAGIAALTLVFFPLARALARRIEGKTVQTDVTPELEELRARVADLEARQGGLAELEERVDFAERLLARESKTLPDAESRGQ